MDASPVIVSPCVIFRTTSLLGPAFALPGVTVSHALSAISFDFSSPLEKVCFVEHHQLQSSGFETFAFSVPVNVLSAIGAAGLGSVFATGVSTLPVSLSCAPESLSGPDEK